MASPTQTRQLQSFTADETESDERIGEDTDEGSMSDEKGTPRDHIVKFHAAIAEATNGARKRFCLDPGTHPQTEAIRIANLIFTKQDDSLTNTWGREEINSIFLNPPYSKPDRFLAKLVSSIDPENDSKATWGICLVKLDPSTEWWQNHMTEAAHICVPDDRIVFEGESGTAPWPSAYATFGNPPKEILAVLDSFGSFYQYVESDSKLEEYADFFDNRSESSDPVFVDVPFPGFDPTSDYVNCEVPDLNIASNQPLNELGRGSELHFTGELNGDGSEQTFYVAVLTDENSIERLC